MLPRCKNSNKTQFLKHKVLEDNCPKEIREEAKGLKRTKINQGS